MCRFLIPLALAVPLAAGCNPIPDYDAQALTTLRPAAVCDPRLPYFGYYSYADDPRPFFNYIPADGSIAMRNDGGWCTIRHEYVYAYRVRTFPMTLTQPPAHGQVVLGAVGGELWLAYRPEPGFIGPDFFRARLHAAIPQDIPVRVTVQP